MQRLIATKSMRYATRRLQAGDVFEAKPRDARLLIAVKKARAERAPGKIAPPPAELVKKAAKRDPFDHDNNGAPGGSTSGGSGEDMTALRKEYTEKMGKRAFPGWDAAELRRRMAAAE